MAAEKKLKVTIKFYEKHFVSQSSHGIKNYHQESCTNNFIENLFRLIFEAQIHIQIQIRYFKYLFIVTH